MKILVVGRGSMGTRRLRDLAEIGVETLSWDLGDTTHAFQQNVDAWVVSTPPDIHERYAEMAEHKGVPFFVEAGIEPPAFVHRRYPSCTPIFVPEIRRIEERIRHGAIGRACAYTHHTGMHLLDWHPGVDLRTYYAAQRETGAVREMVPFELIWLTHLFGRIARIEPIIARVGDLPAEIDDVAQVLVEHSSGVIGHLLIDALARPPQRRVTIVGTEGVIVQEIHYSESVYLAEMSAFVRALEGRQEWPYSVKDQQSLLAITTPRLSALARIV